MPKCLILLMTLGSTGRDGCRVIEFGIAYPRVRQALRRIERMVGATLIESSPLSLEGVREAAQQLRLAVISGGQYHHLIEGLTRPRGIRPDGWQKGVSRLLEESVPQPHALS